MIRRKQRIRRKVACQIRSGAMDQKIINQTKNACDAVPKSLFDVLTRLSPHALDLPVLQSTNYYQEEEDSLNKDKVKLEIDDNVSDLSVLLQNFGSGHLCFIGPVGSGKTTLLRIIVHGLLNKSYDIPGVKVIFFLVGQDFATEERTTPSDLLLNGLTNNPAPLKLQYLKEVRRNPEKFLFIVDSLDTLPFSLCDTRPPIKLDAKEVPATILHNILNKNLFPRVRIITTTREYVIRPLRRELRPDIVVSLTGFSQKSIESVVSEYFEEGEKAAAVKSQLQTDPSLTSICSSPLLLSYTLYCYEKEGHLHPHTMTRILDKVFQSLLSSGNFTKDFHKVMKALASLGYKCGQRNDITFDKKQLTNRGLTLKDVENFISCGILRNGFRNSDLLSFCHSAIQEYMAATHVSQLRAQDFASFAESQLSEQKSSSTRSIICGLVLDEKLSRSNAARFSTKDVGEKRTILKEWFCKKLEEEMTGGQDMLGIIHAIFESGDGLNEVIGSRLRSIVVKGGESCFHSLSPSDIYAIATVAGKARCLKKLKLPRNNLSTHNFRVLTNVLLSVESIMISEIDFSDNYLIGTKGLTCAGKIVNHCRAEALDIHGCELDAGDIYALRRNLNGSIMKRLDLSYSHAADTEEKMTPENRKTHFEFKLRVAGVGIAIGKVTPMFRELRFREWRPGEWDEVDDDVIDELTKLLPSVSEEIKLFGWKLNLSQRDRLQLNVDRLWPKSPKIVLTKNDFIVSSATHKLFQAGDCNFVREDEHESDHNVRNLLEVQIAHNHLTDDRIAFLASKFGKNQTLDEVELRDCELDTPILEKFNVTLQAAGCKIGKLSVNLSRHLKDLLPGICKIVERCETKFLSIAENNVTGNEMTILEEILRDMKETKLRGLDVGNNENLGNLEPLGRIIQSRGLTDLNLMSCELTDQQLETLSSVQGLLLKSVNLGFNSEITRKGFQCLSSLLHPEKIDLLDVTGCEMTGDKLNELKDVLTNREVIELDVNYNELQRPDMTVLGELAENSKVHMLGVVGCDLDRRRLTLFNGALGQHKFETLDATDNNKLSGCAKELATLAKRCSALNISESGLQGEEICLFTSEMGESTIEILNVSDSNRVITEGSRMLQSLCSLIPIVKKKLLFCFKEVNESSRAILKSQLIKLQKKDLAIVFDQSCDCEDQNGFSFVMSKKDDVLN